MISQTKKWYDRVGKTAYSPYADIILGLLFFVEAIFFLPTDPILILYCLQRQNRAFTFAAIATCGSVLGGLTSYFLGYWLWEYAGYEIITNKWVNYILTPQMFEQLSHSYEKNEWLAIFAAGFTPIPYKAATLTAGFCKLSLLPFITASIASRGARFFAYAIFITWLGVSIRQTIERYFTLMMVGSVVLLVATFYLLK